MIQIHSGSNHLKPNIESFNLTKYILLQTIDYTLFEFSYENTPDMPVYLASLASCSIPPVFGPILYADDYYIDGGFLNNYPVNSCLNSSKCAKEEILGIRVITDRSLMKIRQYLNLTLEELSLGSSLEFLS